MTYSSGKRNDVTAYDPEISSRRALVRNLCGGLALTGAVLACGWLLSGNPAGVPVDAAVTAESIVSPAPAEAIDPLIYAALFDAAYSSGSRPGALVDSDPLETDFQPLTGAFAKADSARPRDVALAPPVIRQLARSIPLPMPRPAMLAMPQSLNPSLHAMAQRNKSPAEEPTMFQKLFGKPKDSGMQLAYAGPDGGVFGDGQSITSGNLGSDKLTAVYDISAHTVYMPDGTKLEAHSGLGSRLDDPNHVHERMRGATPPHVYDLSMRESLFHGVRALRLNPVGGMNPHGRTGLLAHTYMLGPNGDSNGCVSFKDYSAFLRAYLDRKVERLVVVARRD